MKLIDNMTPKELEDHLLPLIGRHIVIKDEYVDGVRSHCWAGRLTAFQILNINKFRATIYLEHDTEPIELTKDDQFRSYLGVVPSLLDYRV